MGEEMLMIKRMSKVLLLAFLFLGCAMSFASGVDVSKYDNEKEEDVRLAKIGIDYFEIGKFEEAAEYFEKALAVAQDAQAPKLYIDNLKTKLATTYINLKQYKKGRALLKEVHGVDTKD